MDFRRPAFNRVEEERRGEGGVDPPVPSSAGARMLSQGSRGGRNR